MALQNNRVESVDILNRQTGDLVTQYSGPGDRIINITQSSVVRINASPESVNFYERQGDDLIVHMRDGSTVRYQHFFQLDAEGLHSELIFEDRYGTHHAVFPFATESGPAATEAIVPVMADTTLGALIGGEGLSNLEILGGLAAVGGIAGVAIAASSRGGGSGNHDGGNGDGGSGGGDGGSNGGNGSNGNNGGDGGNNDNGGNGGEGGNGNGGDNGGETTPPGGENPQPPVSSLVVAPFTDDNVVNLEESGSDQILSGTTEAANAGRTLVVTLGNNSWTAVVNGDGSWNVTLPAGVLQALPQGEVTLTVTLVDSNGNTVSQNITLTIDTIAPELNLNEFSPGNVLDQAQIDNGKIISGFSSPQDAGQTVVILLGDNRFEAVIAQDGSWSALIPSAVLQTLQDQQGYTLDISVMDAAGNTTTAEQHFTVNTSQPAIQLEPLTGDNLLNGAEIALNQILVGSTANIAPGQTVFVTLGANTYFTQVAGDGSFRVTLPAGDLQALVPPTEIITVWCQDNNGDPIAMTSQTLIVDPSLNAIAIAILSTDDYLSAAESTQPLEVRGITTVTGPSVAVTVTFNGKNYAALVDGAGNWSAVIPPEDLAALPDGVTPVTATVTYGIDSASDSRNLNVMVNYLPKPTLDVLFGDGFLNAAEVTVNQSISGTTGVTGAGQKVTVQFGDKIYHAVVDGDGRWSVAVPAADLQNLRDGAVSVNVNALDAAGNSVKLAGSATVDTTPPLLSLLPLTGDGKLSAAELGAAQTLAGITTPDQHGQEVVVNINSQRFTTTVNSDGTWHVALPAGSLSSLEAGDRNYIVTLVDSAGNSQTVTGTVSVKTAQPLLSVDPFTANNALDAAEVKTDQWLTGSTQNVEAGSTIVVVLGHQEFSTRVDADGNWRIPVTAADLQKLADGVNTLYVSVTDSFGQTASQPHSFVVDKSQSAVAIAIVADDDYLNQAEASEELVVRGTSAGLPEGTIIQVNFGGLILSTAVAAEGRWSVMLTPTQLADLSDGPLTITVTATAPDNSTVTDSHLLNVVVDNLPVPTLNAPFGDGVLNLAERGQSHQLTGSTGVTGAGQQVDVTLNGITYRGQVAADGSWSVSLPAGALTGLTDADSPVALVVTATDAAGNVVPLNGSFTVDITPPAITVLPFASDDIVNLAEAGAQQTLSGTAPGAEGGQPVTVVLNGVTWQTITGTLGGWEIPIPAAVLQALPNGPINVTITVTDSAGNATTVTHTLIVDTDPQQQPRLVIDPVTSNNIIDAGERLADVTLTGYTLNVEAGQIVTVTLGNGSWTGQVDAQGRWTVTVPQAAIAALPDGAATLTVTVADVSGNTVSQNRAFTVNLDSSSLTLDPITGDNIIGVNDLAGGLPITGHSVNIAEGTLLTITLNGKHYSATVGAGGIWSVPIPQADAAALADGIATLTVSGIDADGNPISTQHSFSVLIHQTPEPTLNTPFTDGIVSGSEINGGTLSGTTGVSGAGQVVTVTLGGATLTATVDASGNWSVAVPGAALAGLDEGSNPLVVTAIDVAGNTNTLESTLVLDTLPPTLTINAIASDNIINIAEAMQEIVISGTAGPFDAERAQYVIIELNGQKYSALIQEGNVWSVTVPAHALSNLPDGPVTVVVTASDAVGNSTTLNTTLILNTDLLSAPTLTFNAVSTDDYVNAAEADNPVALSGTTTFVEAGQQVVLTLNGVEYRATVQPNGAWTVNVPALALANIADGPHAITAVVTDVAGNPASATRTVTFIASEANQPGLTVDVVAGDDVINAQEQDRPLIVTGASGNLPQGTPVNVSLGDGNYLGSVGADGKWQVTIPAADLQALADRGYNLVATARDPAQNVATTTRPITVDTSGPAVAIDAAGFYADGQLNISEAGVNQLLTGTTSAGSTVTLTINNSTLTTRADTNGVWQLTLPAQDLQALNQGVNNLVLVVTDPQGNITYQALPIDVGTRAPTLTLDTVFSDNLVNINEANAGGTLSGTATGFDDGAIVTLSLGLTQLGAATVVGGVWSLNVDAGVLAALSSGQYVLTASAADAYGNPASVSADIELLLTAPTAELPGNLFGTDDFINQAEASVGQTLTGNTGLTGSGQTVLITIGGLDPLAGSVDDLGNWSVQLPADFLQNLPDGPYTLTVTVGDKAGNTTTSPTETFEVRTDTLPVPTLTPPFNDGILNYAEAGDGGLMGGSIGLAAQQVAQVTVSINNGPALVATINGDGSWSLPLTQAQLQALPDGTLPVTIVVTDVAGNTSTGTSSFDVAINTLPVATFVTPFVDGVLNYAESQTPQTIRGNTGISGAGQSVSLTFNGEAYAGTVNAQGEWSVTLPTSAFVGLVSGTTPTMTVVVTDAALNTDSETLNYGVQTARPTPQVTSLFGNDGFLNAAEAAGPLTISGVTGVSGTGQYVTVTIDVNGARYVANVTPQGNWSVPLPAGALQSLVNGPHSITVTAQDQYGNATPLTVPFTSALTPPTVTINTPIFTDGYVNIEEANDGVQLSGSLTTGVPDGTTVSVNIGGAIFNALVSGNTWSLSLTADDLNGVPNGPQSVVVTVTDGALNPGSATTPVTIALIEPTITVNVPFGEGALSFAESQQLQTIGGTTTRVEAGQTVTVTLADQVFTTQVQADGSWSLSLTPQQMGLLTQGDVTLVATVSDRAQNPAASPALDITIDTAPPEYSVTVNPPGGDGYLNAAELSGATIAIAGQTTGFAAGQQIAITVNGTVIGNATIGDAGEWTLNVPVAVFQAQTSYTVTATTLDAPVTSGSAGAIVDTLPPTVVINPVSDNDIINAADSGQSLVISGTAVGEAGRTVTVTLGTQTGYGTVDGAGNWSITLTPAQVAVLPNGTLNVTASMTDAAGNGSTETRPIVVDRDAPLLVVDTLGVPALLTTTTALPGVLLGGRGDPGETVTVRVGPLVASATVGEDGRWTLNSTDLDLTTLSDGAQVIAITSTDAAGNTSTNNVALNVALNRGLGVVVEDLIGGDGILNVAESLLTQTLTGSITGDYRGATVQATLLGTDITLPLVGVGPDGRFSINFPPELWSQILTNTVSLQLDVTDANGNTTNEIIDVRLALTDLPVIGNVVAAADNIINVLDSTTNQLVTGTLSTVDNVTGVVVTLAGRTFEATLNGLQWSATLPAEVLAALPDGTVSLLVTVTDTFGNVVSNTTNLTVALRNLPTIALDPLFGDGTLSIPELLNGLVSGTATGLAGQTLTISIGAAPAFTAAVGLDGRWSAALPPDVREVLQSVGSGNIAVNVSASDRNGNVASVGNTLRVDLLQPVLNTLTLFGDGLLNAVDAQTAQTISGVVGNAPVGSTVSVAINGRSFTGVVAGNGAFSINIGPAQLALLADGVFTPTVTITTPNGNTSQVPGPSPVTIGLTNLPGIVVNTLFGDGYLNQAEAGVAQTINGTVSNLASGTVLVRIGGATLEAAINNGAWSVQVSPEVLRALPDGALNITATVQDAVGNVAVGNKVLNSIINAIPSLTVNTPFGDGALSLTDLLTNQVLSGRAVNLAAGSEVTVNLGLLSLKTTVAADGTWQLSVPVGLLQGLADGLQTVTVTARDAAGNVARGLGDLVVSIGAQPSIVLDPLFGDGGLNATDILSAKVITGSSTNAVGAQVNLTLGGKAYQTTVGADGHWSIPVSQTDLGALLDGSLTVNASLINAAGKSANTSGLLNVVTHSLPSISLTTLFGNDSYLNVTEANAGQILSGRITGADSGASVVVTLGSTPYNATVNPDGTWSLALNSAILNGLTNGPLKVGVAVTDSVGNVNRTSTDVTVKLTTPEITFNALQSLNLVTLLSKGLTLNGGSRNLGAGAVVHLSLLNNTVTTTAITDANGNWSTNIGLGLNILQLLSLSSVLSIYSSDVAGNTGYLNVGLGGNVISTTPPAGITVSQTETEAFSLLAASASVQSEEPTTQPGHTPPVAHDDVAVTAAPQTAASASELSSFTIGGVSIDLADGTHQSGETLQGSAGNDTIHLSTLGFTQIDAGAGTDTLMLDGINMTLDLTALTGKLHNIEIFDLGKSGTNAITVDLNEAITITDKPEDDLLIKGSAGDRVNLVHGQGDIWQVSGQREVDGVQFDVYHNSSQTNTLGDVLVQHGLHVNMV